MTSKRPKKNRSARDRQLARDRARREARQEQGTYRLHYLQPPFKGYEEWIDVPDQAKEMFEHPARHDDRLTESAKDLADAIVKLGPRYQGRVPMAALYLDEQIREGTILIAVTGEPGVVREMPLLELAADLSNPQVQDDLHRQHPQLPVGSTTMTDDEAAWSLHELHVSAFLIMDDDNVVNMAIPPEKPGGRWWLNGHDG